MMISAAMATVLISVTISPELSCRDAPCGPATSISPVKARMMPSVGINPGRRPNTSHCNNGTQGT